MKLKMLALVGIAGLLLSACSSSGAYTEGSKRLYKVAEGESLLTIAEDEYGDGEHWRIIYNANRDSIDQPNLIYPGQVLRLPVKKYSTSRKRIEMTDGDEYSFPENPWDFNVDRNR